MSGYANLNAYADPNVLLQTQGGQAVTAIDAQQIANQYAPQRNQLFIDTGQEALSYARQLDPLNIQEKRQQLGLETNPNLERMMRLYGGDTGAAPAAGGAGGGGPGYAPTGTPLTPYIAPNLPQGVSTAEDQAVRTVIGEAGGEPLIGQAGVAHVIANRMKQSGGSAQDVIFAPNQFEPWNNQATRAKLEAIDPNSAQYQTILNNVVRPALSGQSQDPTGGATHFYSPTAQAALGRQPPSWGTGTPTVIGRHNFYNIGYAAPPGGGGGTGTVQAGGQPPAGPVILGDSLASAGGLGGSGVVGAKPQQVLEQVQERAKAGALRGQDVVISTGASNDPSATALAEQQIQAAKDGGAKSVTLVGVGNRPDIAGANPLLAQIAARNGARFVPIDQATLSGDQVHPANYAPLRQAVRLGGTATAGPGAGAPPAVPAPPAGASGPAQQAPRDAAGNITGPGLVGSQGLVATPDAQGGFTVGTPRNAVLPAITTPPPAGAQAQPPPDAERQIIAAAAQQVLAEPPERRAAAYAALVPQLQAAGYAKNAPAQYPGDAVMAQIAGGGTGAAGGAGGAPASTAQPPATGLNSPQVQQAQAMLRKAAQIELMAAQTPNDPRAKATAAAMVADLKARAAILMQADSTIVDPRTGVQTSVLTGKETSAAEPRPDYQVDPNNPGVLVSPGRAPIVMPAGRAVKMPNGSIAVIGPGGSFKVVSGADLEGQSASAAANAAGSATAAATAKLADSLPGIARNSTQAISNIDYGLRQLDKAKAGGIPTGYFSAALARTAAMAKSLGISVPGVEPGAVSDIQTANKTLAVVSGAILQNILGNGAITDGKIEAFIHAQPGIENDPDAIHRILNWARSQFVYDNEMALDGLANINPSSGVLSPGWRAGYMVKHGAGPIFDTGTGEMQQPEGRTPSREPPSQFTEGQTATGKDGQKAVFRNGNWVLNP